MEHVIFVASRLGVRDPVGGSLEPDTAGFAVLRVSTERVVRSQEKCRACVYRRGGARSSRQRDDRPGRHRRDRDEPRRGVRAQERQTPGRLTRGARAARWFESEAGRGAKGRDARKLRGSRGGNNCLSQWCQLRRQAVGGGTTHRSQGDCRSEVPTKGGRRSTIKSRG